MKNKTIVILKETDNDAWEINERIIDVYLVPRKNFNVEQAYSKFLFEKFKEKTTVDVQWKEQAYAPGIFTVHYPKMNAKDRKAIGQVIKEHDIKTFLESINGVRVNHFTEYFK